MSIILLSGLPGSGKSLNAISQFILPQLKRGRTVYTNIEGLNHLAISIYLDMPLMDVDNLLVSTDITGKTLEFTTSMVKKLPHGCFVCIDEAQRFWNNRAYSSPENIELLPHLQQHRHYGQDFLFVTQNMDQLDIGIRRLTQCHYRLAKLVNAGLDKTVKVKVYPDAMGSEQFAPMSTLIWRIKKQIFALYKSYEDGVIGEQKPFTSNIIIKNPRVMFALITLAVTSVLVYNGIWQKKGRIFEPETSKYQLPADWMAYHCAKEMVYVQHQSGQVDKIETRLIKAEMCPEIGYTAERQE